MSKKPNVVLFITDHTNADALRAHTACQTPNIDRIASEGVRFQRCHTTNAICSPARASLMTALYPSCHGMWDCTHTQRAEWVDVPADRFTYFSTRFADAGYDTAYFGKWHVEQSNKLENFGWKQYDLESRSARGAPDPGTELVVETPGYRPHTLAGVSSDAAAQSHPAFDRGIEFIRTHQNESPDDPFLCVISSIEPHDPYITPKRFYDMYDPESIELSPTINDELSGKPEVLRRMRSVWSSLSEADWRKATTCYWAVISFLDHEIGRVLSVLEETGQTDDTIIIFTSDHGDMVGGHGLITKGVGTSYEEVYNIPLVIRSPEGRKGADINDALVSMVDIAPTLLDLCGLEPLEGCHGRSMRPILEGSYEPNRWRDGYAEFFGQRFVYTQRITWFDNWKYVFSPGGIDELYNLEADPHERVNCAEDPAYSDVLEDMAKRMWRKMKRIGDESLYNTHYATLRTAPVGPLASEEGGS